MNKSRGILFITLSPTYDVMKNITALVFNPAAKKEIGFPEIGKVTFLQPKEFPNIKVDDKQLSPAEACEKVLSDNHIENVQLRIHPVLDYTKDIPEVITDAVNEVGKENIIIDLTSGKKDITGSLYTAATISEIKNVIYVDVHRGLKDEQGRQNFYMLEKNDPDIMDKLELTIFKTDQEISDLASLNCVDFIWYRKTIDDLALSINNSKLDMYFSQMSKAVDSYFDPKKDKYDNCIRDIGMVAEELKERLIIFMTNEYNDILEKESSFEDGQKGSKVAKKQMKKTGLRVIMSLEDKYQIDSNPETLKKAGADKKEELDHLEKVFGEAPAICDMLNIIRIYRNKSSHSGKGIVRQEDAKIVLDLAIKIFTDLNRTGILNEMFKESGE